MSAYPFAIFIDPISRHFEADRLFDAADPHLNRDDLIRPYVYLQEWFAERGVPVHTADLFASGRVHAQRSIYLSLGMRNRYRRISEHGGVTASAFFALECPAVEPTMYRELPAVDRVFRRVYSFSDPDSLLPFTGRRIETSLFRIPQASGRVREDLWKRPNRQFLTLINSNKRPRDTRYELYSERLRALNHFAQREAIDLYGVGWDVPTYQMGETWLPGTVQRMARAVRTGWNRIHPDPALRWARTVYRGTPISKLDTLSAYTFAICFENMSLGGWITEKLFDCFLAGTIPVYLGAPDVAEIVPDSCFIDMRHFDDYTELEEYLRSLGPAEIMAYRESAREFLASERFRPFMKETFVEVVARIVEEDAGIRLVDGMPA